MSIDVNNVSFSTPEMKQNIAGVMFDSSTKITYNEETWNQMIMLYQGEFHMKNPVMITNGNITRIQISNDLKLCAQTISLQFFDDSMKIAKYIALNDTYLIIHMQQLSNVQAKTKKENEKIIPTLYTRYFCNR